MNFKKFKPGEKATINFLPYPADKELSETFGMIRGMESKKFKHIGGRFVQECKPKCSICELLGPPKEVIVHMSPDGKSYCIKKKKNEK